MIRLLKNRIQNPLGNYLKNRIPQMLITKAFSANLGKANVDIFENQVLLFNKTKIEVFLLKGSGSTVLIMPSTMFGISSIADFISSNISKIKQKYKLVIIYYQPSQGKSTGVPNTKNMLKSMSIITQKFAVDYKTLFVGISAGSIPVFQQSLLDQKNRYIAINPMPSSSQLATNILSGYFDELATKHNSKKILQLTKAIIRRFPSIKNNSVIAIPQKLDLQVWLPEKDEWVQNWQNNKNFDSLNKGQLIRTKNTNHSSIKTQLTQVIL